MMVNMLPGIGDGQVVDAPPYNPAPFTTRGTEPYQPELWTASTPACGLVFQNVPGPRTALMVVPVFLSMPMVA